MSSPSDPLADFGRLFDHAFTTWSAAQRVHSPIASTHPSPHAPRPDAPPRDASFRPRVDVHENAAANAVIVRVDLPGIARRDISLQVRHGQLFISGVAHRPDTREGYVVCERHYGAFARTLPLPPGVNADDVDAALADGVLTVTFPCSKEDPEACMIEVK